MGDQNTSYNSQFVSYLLALHQFHNAETGSEDPFSLHHRIQGSSNATSAGSIGPALPALGHALAGGAATAGTKLLLYPLELVATRLQVQRQLHGLKEAPSAAHDADAEYSSLVDAVQKIYKNEGGLRAFYTGCAPDVGKGIADSFLFFLGYTYLRQRQLRRDGTKDLSVLKELSVGVAAGAFAKLITTPIQNIVTRQQTAALVAARDPTFTATPGESGTLSVKDIALQIRSERGLAGFWAGYSASIILTLNPAITFAVDNMLKHLLPEPRRLNPPPQLTFLIAALSKAIATTLTYPVMLAKSRAQIASPTSIAQEEGTLEKSAVAADETPRPKKRPEMLKHRARQALRMLSAQYAILLSLRAIYRTEGLEGLYSGLSAEVLKGFLSHGLTMVAKEKVHVAVIQLYYVLLRMTSRWPADVKKASDGAQTVVGGVREKVGGVAAKATESAQGVANGVVERAGGVGGRVAEGAIRVVEEGRKVVGGDGK
ncbi:hypothetical protein LTR08_003147 [Meristemomyces frigidus]|nr:hypothetical protein LTR08_003147 [Meristemomyces frigidus]